VKGLGVRVQGFNPIREAEFLFGKGYVGSVLHIPTLVKRHLAWLAPFAQGGFRDHVLGFKDWG
jgi:hypothetical protein